MVLTYTVPLATMTSVPDADQRGLHVRGDPEQPAPPPASKASTLVPSEPSAMSTEPAIATGAALTDEVHSGV